MCIICSLIEIVITKQWWRYCINIVKKKKKGVMYFLFIISSIIALLIDVTCTYKQMIIIYREKP